MLLCRSLLCQTRVQSRRVVASAHVHTEAKLEELGITLPQVIPAKGNYMSFVRSGNHLFLAGRAM